MEVNVRRLAIDRQHVTEFAGSGTVQSRAVAKRKAEMEWRPTASVSPLQPDPENVERDQPLNDAIDQLPVLYASALRLRARGTPHDEIAERIGVHPEAIDTVLRLADEKLHLLRAGIASEKAGED